MVKGWYANGTARWFAHVYKSALDLSDSVRRSEQQAASPIVWQCDTDLKPGVFDAPLRGSGA
jgi:hypothetical protein